MAIEFNETDRILKSGQLAGLLGGLEGTAICGLLQRSAELGDIANATLILGNEEAVGKLLVGPVALGNALGVAARKGQAEHVQAMVNNPHIVKAILTGRNSKDIVCYAFLDAVQNGHFDCAQLLTGNASINARIESKATPETQLGMDLHAALNSLASQYSVATKGGEEVGAVAAGAGRVI